MKIRHLFSVLIFSLGFVVPASAQQVNQVPSVLEVYKITVDENGEEIATQITSSNPEVTPGDLIEYRVTYTNNSGGDISLLRPVLPIPAGMEYEVGSADPDAEGASLSNTGNTFQDLPLTRQVRRPDGTTATEEVPGREYRRLRWLVPSLEAGEQVILVARAKVIEN